MNDSKSISPQRKIAIISSMSVLLVIVFILSIAIGANNYTTEEILKGLFVNDNSTLRIIIFNVRLPRIIAAALVGICLSLSGCILQGVMRNNMASPSTIGVTSGASFAGYLMLVAFPKYAHMLPVGAFIGSCLTTLFIYSLAYKEGVSPVKMILSGLAVSALLGAFNDVIKTFFNDNIASVTSFLVGGLNGVTWGSIRVVLPYALVGIIGCIVLPSKMNILVLGDEVANSLGLQTEKFKLILIILSSFLSASAISIVGVISFVGLIVPHISRLLVGSDYKFLFPSSIIFGALLLIVCDTIGRVIILPAEMPVGIIMAFIGSPFFLYLLRKKSNGGC